MKRNGILTLSLMIAFVAGLNSINAQENDICGSWMGKLNVGGVQLRLVFNIDKNEDGALSATLDSPDQGARGIPLGKVSYADDSLIIAAPALYGEYKGVFTSDTTLDGGWTQMGVSYDLDLVLQKEALVLNRPQEPKAPFPYLVEELNYPSLDGSFTLAGTITVPEEGGPFPAVILVSGSGSQNRNEEIYEHKPFMVLADYLTLNGIAVLRYDDRGAYGSGGSVIGATSKDYADDARAAIELLLSRDDIKKKEIGVIGHSEGGLIAFMLAKDYSDIAFIVSLAGPGVSGRTILIDQAAYISRLSGMAEEIIEQNSEVNKKIYTTLEENEKPEEGLAVINDFIRDYYGSNGVGEEQIEQIIKNMSGFLNQSSYPWLRFFSLSDPLDYFPEIKCSVLALNGEKDCQVMAEKNINAIIAGLKEAGNTDVTGMILPGLNHLFQHATTGLVNEYFEIEETFSPQALEIITNWIKKQSLIPNP